MVTAAPDIETTTRLTPRPYQQEGIDFLRTTKRALLYDAPGLGKTLQASRAATSPTLIVCPVYIAEQWYDFIKQEYPNDRVHLALGSGARKRALLQNGSAEWYITNIETIRTIEPPLVNTFIIDESHRVRNRQARQSKAAFLVAKRTPNVFLLTGTPIFKDPDDLYMQLHILDPENISSYNRFVNEYCNTYNNGWTYRVSGIRNERGLKALLANYALGRTYDDVGMWLPPIIESVVRVQMNPNLKQVYRDVKVSYRMEEITLTSAMEAMQTLRMVTSVAKYEYMKTVLADLAFKNILVFTWYKDSAREVANILNCPYVNGDMSLTERVAIVKNHATKGGPLVGTIGSMSEGVDLAYMEAVIFFEEDWTPGSLHQALCRVRRFDKTGNNVGKSLPIYYLLAQDSVDVHIHRAITKRVADVRKIFKESII